MGGCRGGFYFQAVFGVESEWTVQCPPLGQWILDFHTSFIGGGQWGGGRGEFIFLSANRRAQGALLLFLLS